MQQQGTISAISHLVCLYQVTSDKQQSMSMILFCVIGLNIIMIIVNTLSIEMKSSLQKLSTQPQFHVQSQQ